MTLPKLDGVPARIASFERSCPPGFLAPQRFLDILRTESLPDIEPWFWIFELTGLQDFWARTIATQYPDRVLVPFAKHEQSDDVFCFDGTNTTGDSPVYIVHTFTSPGYERRGYWDSFDVFLDAADETHREWLAEGDE